MPPVSLSTIKPKTKAIMSFMYDYYLLPFVQTGDLTPPACSVKLFFSDFLKRKTADQCLQMHSMQALTS